MENGIITDEAFIMWISGRLKGMSDGFDGPMYDEKRDTLYRKLNTATEVYLEYLRDRQSLTHYEKSATPLGELTHAEAVKRISDMTKKSS